jgi:hypothetical protein
MSALAERAILATLNISQWQGRKFDRYETAAVNLKHGISGQAARVNKALLPRCAELQLVQQVTGTIRKEFDRYTLPWSVDGMRILKSDIYMDFAGKVNAWRDEWDQAKKAFLKAYPQLRYDAQKSLGGLYSVEDYPDPSDLKHRFQFRVRFMPIADNNDWRIDVGDEAMARLKADVSAQLAEVEAEAMREAWRRVHDVVEKTVERLSNPEAIFRDSLVDNAIELCSMMPSLNISNDPKMETVRQSIERTLARFQGDVDSLRHNPEEREAAADKMAEVLRKMAGYMPKKAA